MISIKTIFIFLVVSNLFALGVISYNYYALRNSDTLVTRNTQAVSDAPASSSSSASLERPKFLYDVKYAFTNPKLAAKALTLLDSYADVPKSYYNTGIESSKHGQPYFGLSTSEDYCNKNREVFADKPDIVFGVNRIMTETDGKSLVRRKVIKDVGLDMMPGVHANMSEDQKKLKIFSLGADLSNFFTNTDMYLYKKIGQEFSCLAQMSNHIPGHNALENQGLLAVSLVKYAKKFVSKPECFSYQQLFPETFILNDKAQCTEFFKFIDTPTYRANKNQRGTVFIRKTISSTDGKVDAKLVDAEEEASLRGLYKEGASCGSIKKDQIVQYHVYNPLLINGKPFDFRVYMLAASSNPLIVYYHDGFLRIAYENANSAGSELTSSFLSTIAPGVDLEGKYQAMSFEDLQSYLLQKGLIQDNNWLDNYLRPELKKAMVHLMKMAATGLLKRSSLYELYAIDFVMDKNLKVWFMEVDANPEFIAVGDENEKFLVKMLKDHFEVVNGLLKSRMKRVVNYINRQMKDGQIAELKQNVQIKNLDQKIKEFTEITKNYWEPEYEPGKENGFSKIIDENYFGVQRNNWILAKECL